VRLSISILVRMKQLGFVFLPSEIILSMMSLSLLG
jgi:hypothetical protein